MIRNWLPEQSQPLSDLDKLSTEFTVSKIGLLVRRIEAFREVLAEVSAMGQVLEQLLVQQLSIIKTKKPEVT